MSAAASRSSMRRSVVALTLFLSLLCAAGHVATFANAAAGDDADAAYHKHAATGHKHHPHHHNADNKDGGGVLEGLEGVNGNPEGRAPQIEFVGETKIEVWAEVKRAGKTMKPVGIGDMVQFHWEAFTEYHAGLSQIVGDMEYRKEQYYSSRHPSGPNVGEGEAAPVMMKLEETSALPGFPDFVNHITKMHLGDFVVLHIPYQLAYGKSGNSLLGIAEEADILIQVEIMGLAQSPENRKKFLEQPLPKKSAAEIAARKAKKAKQNDGL